MRASLAKSDILRGYGTFSEVIGKGQTHLASPLRMFVLADSGNSAKLHVGFATSRQIRSAASRNKLKRLMREAFRLEKGLLDGYKGSIVFMFVGAADSENKRISMDEIRQRMIGLMKRVQLGERHGMAP